MSAARAARTAAGASQLARQLDDLVAMLRAPRQRIEGAFVDIGGRLGECTQILRQISTAFEALPLEFESQEMGEATRRLELVSERAVAMPSSFAAERSDIVRLMAMVSDVGGPIASLRRAVRVIGLVAVNARITAAGLPGRHDDLSVFTTDITRLSERAAKTVKQFAGVYEALVEALRTADSERTSFEGKHKDTLRLLGERLTTSLAAVGAQRREAANASVQIGQMSSQIANRVGTAVFALQIGDITRQRVEHVEEALSGLVDLIGSGEPDDDANAQVATVCRLQSALMEQAVTEFEREVTQVVDALLELAADAGQVVQHAQKTFGGAGSGTASSLGDLGGELQQVCKVLRGSEEARADLDRAAASVADTVTDMLRHVEAVQEVEGDMRLVSLNTALACARLGDDGRALAVIAQELRALTQDTAVQAELAVNGLKEAAALARSLRTVWAGDPSSSAGSLEDEANLSIGLLRTIDTRLSDMLAGLVRDGGRATSLLEHAAAKVSSDEDIGGALRNGIAQLERTRVQALSAYCDATGQDALVVEKRVLSQVKGQYTMESERLLHESLAKNSDVSAAPAAKFASTPSDAGLDDIFF